MKRVFLWMKQALSHNAKKHYTLSQLAYFISVPFVLLFLLLPEAKVLLYLGAGFAFLGILREILSLFKVLWNTTLGKSIIIVIYALVTNLAFSIAAIYVSKVTGVEPFPFTYTLGFTTFLLMPIWITFSSVLLLSLGIVFANAWLFLRLGLKLFGVQLKVHWEDKNYAILTMILRIVLIPVILYAAIDANLPMAYKPGSTDGDTAAVGISIYRADSSDDQESSTIAKNDTSEFEVNETLDVNRKRDLTFSIEPLIAGFIWNFESYTNSMCKKGKEQKSVIIDDDSVLLISIDEEQQYGYKFELSKCIPNYVNDLNVKKQDNALQ